MNRDKLFVTIVYILVGLIVVYGIGITIVLAITQPSDTVVTRFISSFGAIFAGLLGLCTGYLMGARTNGNGK